ncbi:heat shock protein Hsp15 [Rhizobium sp. RU20A]|uniref:RNA-binding S4 domain-containing protein n=1 Tax=Rhizobium sp. RU20A TaxID=1907412 RepID=UPI000955F6BF|nr:RNA-binding S4 domain-containing protein [Rhizobium sp. RU20A]SIR40322.1 heat shock protein Hsp15 [Rhizobium sp. RU20A]
MAPASGHTGEARQRLDKWLFFTRLVKSRSLAQKLIEDGRVRVNGTRTTQSSAQLRIGDTLVLDLDHHDTTVKVLGPGERRGPYPEARLLYEDLTPTPTEGDQPLAFAAREPGAGRPTKRERRAIDRLLRDDD